MQPSEATAFFDYAIIGGGISGVVCAETLCELIQPGKYSGAKQNVPCKRSVALISANSTVRTTVNLRRITNLIETFDINDASGESWSSAWPGVLHLIVDTVSEIRPSEHLIFLDGRGRSKPLKYGRLCLATGGVPRLIDKKSPFVIGLRDTDSLSAFQHRLKTTRRLVLIGNGGIATEIAHEVRGCEIIWGIKDASISTPFLDPVAAKFLLEARNSSSAEVAETPIIRRMRYEIKSQSSTDNISAKNEVALVSADEPSLEKNGKSLKDTVGCAVGPDWAHGRELIGVSPNLSDRPSLKVIYNVQVKRLLTPSEFETSREEVTPKENWPVYVEFTNGAVYGCDLIVSAVGVEANFEPGKIESTDTLFGVAFERAPLNHGGGVLVNDQMQTSVTDVYAAGDCAYANWERSQHWFQMRLWSQARLMGFQAAKAMYGHDNDEPVVPMDFSFELFTHVTHFFGFKIVLLGLYNGQTLDLTSPECYLLLRITPGKEYVKCIMKSGRMQGALLIGETDLEETFENLIVDQLDLRQLEDSLLDPDIDLSDYFD